jgi:hypothetical protein
VIFVTVYFVQPTHLPTSLLSSFLPLPSMQLYPFLCLLLPLVTSFSPGSLAPPLSSSLSPYKTTSNAPNALFSTPAEFSNYMVKSQEAKQIMQAEIDGLKKQIASGAGGAASADGGDAKKIAE